MDLRDYLRLLRRGWAAVLACTVLGVAAGTAVTLVTKKVYQANVQIFVATSNTSNATDLSQGNIFTQDRVQSYTSIANSPAVTKAVIEKLGLPLTEQELADKISAEAPLNKVLINLHITDHDPRLAASIANAVAQRFSAVVQETEQTDANGKPVVKLTVIHPAAVPSSPIEPNKLLDIGLGLVLGLLIGFAVVILRNALDTTVKGPSDFVELNVPVLGVVPFDKRTTKVPIAFRGDPHGIRSESYRQLRTNLQFVDVDNPPRIISITSAIPGEGKSTTALNLAAALAEAGARVCLVEADLRRPTIARALGLVGDVGFTTVLIGRTNVENVLQNAGRNLAVLTSGPIPPNPSELLITAHAREVIQQIAAQVDFVIIDTPPLLPVTDGANVATIAEAALLVTRAGKTTRDQSRQAIETLERVGKRPVGVILNMITRRRGSNGNEYSYYYTYEPRRKDDKSSPGLVALAETSDGDVAGRHSSEGVQAAGAVGGPGAVRPSPSPGGTAAHAGSFPAGYGAPSAGGGAPPVNGGPTRHTNPAGDGLAPNGAPNVAANPRSGPRGAAEK